ncbi:hypothetical protein KI387_025798, partial [Taxus chinensis]
VMSLMVRLSTENVNAMNKDGNTFLHLLDKETWEPFSSHETGAISKRGDNRLEKSTGNNVVSNSQMSDESIQKRNETLFFIAVLLTTVSYVAAFTIPGGFDSQTGSPVLMHAPALKVFIISDTLAMCLSMGALFTPLFLPVAGSIFDAPFQPPGRDELETSSQLGACLILLALYATMVSFCTGVYVMVAPKCLWLAILVCFITIASLTIVGNSIAFPCELPHNNSEEYEQKLK